MLGWWRRRQRRIDCETLWPVLKEGAPTLDAARAAFYLHCALDQAWRDLPPEEMVSTIEALR